MSVFLGLLICLGLCTSGRTQDDIKLPELDLQYVPADQLNAVLRSDRPGVQLSAREFEELLRRAAQENQRRQGTPLTIALKQVDVLARIQTDQLHAELTVSAESFVDGWTSLDVPLAMWGVNAANEVSVDGETQPAAISRRPDDPAVVTWMLHGRGTHRLVFDLTATLTAAGNDTVVNIGLPAAPTGVFSVLLPPRRYLELDGVRVDRPGEIDEESLVSIPIGQRSELPLRLTDRISVNLAESLAIATSTISVGVTQSQVRWSATTDLSVFGSGLDQLACVIPGSLEVTQVTAEGLQAWELSDADMPMEADGVPTTILLQFRQPIQGSRRITFEGVLSDVVDSTQGWRVPTLTLEGVSSHVGYVAVEVATGLRLKTLDTGNLRTIEPVEFPQAIDPTHTYLFQFWDQAFDLILATLPREREVHVAMTNIVEIGNEGLSLVSAIAVTPLFEPMFEVEIAIPADWNVLSATVDGVATNWQHIPRAAGERVLRIAFAQPATPGVTKSIQINSYRLPEVWPVQEAPQQLSLPAVELSQADVVEAVYGVVCEDSLEVQTVDLAGLDPASQVEIDQMNARLAQFGKSLTLGFVYQNSHFSGDISLSRRSSQMFVDLTSLIELQPDSAVVYWRGAIQVEGGGLKQLQVSVPADAGDDVRFTLSAGSVPEELASLGMPHPSSIGVPRIVQQTLSEPVLGRRTWTLELDRRLIGRAVLSAVFQFSRQEAAPVEDAEVTPDAAGPTNDVTDDNVADSTAAEDAADVDRTDNDTTTDEPMPSDSIEEPATQVADAVDNSAEAVDAEAAEEVDVTQRLRSIFVTGAVRTSSIIAVIGREEQHLQVSAETDHGAPLDLIDPIDVPLGDPWQRPRMVASYQTADPEWELSLSEDRLPGESMPTVVFDQLRLASLLGRAGEGQHQAVAQVRAVGIQGLRIALPEGSELWSVTLDSRPIEVRNETTAIFLPWPSNLTADEIHALEITWKTTERAFGPMASVEQVPPAFEAVTGAGDVVHVELLHQTWELMHPEEAVLVSNRGEFKPQAPLVVSSLLSRLPREFAWPTGQEVTETLIALCLLIVVVGVVVLIMRQRSLFVDEDRRNIRWIGWAAGGALALVVLIFTVQMFTAQQAASERAIATSETAAYSSVDGRVPMDDVAYPSAEMYDAEADEFGGGGGFGGGMGGFDGAPFEEESELSATTSAPEAEMPFEGVESTTAPSAVAATPAAPGGQQGQGQGSDPGSSGVFRDGAGLPQDFPGVDVSPGSSGPVPREEGPNRTLAGLGEPSLFADDANAPFGLQPPPAANGPASDAAPYGTPGEAGLIRSRGALLSLPISMVVPPRTVTTSFEYIGAQADTARTRLSVIYVDRELGQLITWAAAALVVLGMWLMRSAPARTRLILALAVPAAVIALALVVPGTWHVVLDGLLIGSLIGLGLWSLVGMVNGCCLKCRTKVEQPPVPGASPPTVTALILFGVYGFWSGATTALADDVEPPTRVIVPYETLDELEQEGISRVIIPRDDFWRLWSAAHPELETVRPPAAALVSQADFSASLDTAGPARVVVTATFDVLALSSGGSAGTASGRSEVLDIPLPLGEVPINASTIEGEPANVVVRDGRLVLLLPRNEIAVEGEEAARRHRLTIEFDLASPGASDAKGEFALPLLSPTSGQITFELPRPSEELELLVGDGREAYELVVEEQGESLRIPSALRSSTRVSWQLREMRGNLESTVHADTGIVIIAGRQGLSVRHAFQVRVLQGSLSEIRMTLPATGRLQQITGGDVVGWQYDQEDSAPELTIFFRSGIEQSTVFTVDLFQPLEIDGATIVDVPMIVLQGVSREAGLLAIYPQDDLTARTQMVSGLRQINVDQFAPAAVPALPATAASQAYRFSGETARSLQLVLEPRSLETVAHSQYGVRIAYRKLMVTLRARVTPAANPRRSILVELPDDFLLTSVAGPSVADWFETRTAEGIRRLQLDLIAPQSGDVEIMLDGNLPRDVAQPETAISLPRVIDVDAYSSELAVWVDDAFEPGLTELGGWNTKDRQQLSPELRSLSATEPWLVFASDAADPAPLVVQLDRGVPRMRAASVTLVAVTQTGIDYGFTLQWDVSQAAADTFVIRLPAWLSGARFDVAGLRQLQTAAVGNDVMEYRIQLVEPVTGRFLVSGTASLPFPEDRQVRAPVIDCRDLGDSPAFDLAGQQHHAMVVNLSRSRIVPNPDTQMETVGRDDVEIILRDDLVQQVMAIVRVREQGVSPTWDIVPSTSDKVSSDLVLQGELTTVLEMDGTWRTRAVYTVRNQGHQYLAINLPDDSRVLSVTVRGLPGRTFARILGERPVHLIPLPTTSAAELSYQIVLTVEGTLAAPLPELFNIVGQELDIPLPKVVSPDQSPEFGLSVGQLLWTVYVPEAVIAEPVTRTGATNLTRHDRREFLQQSLSIGISNYASESADLIQMATDEQSSLAQRQQALESLQEINRQISNWSIAGGASISSLSPDLLSDQDQLIASNAAVVEQNYGLLEADISEQALSQQDLGRSFTFNNGAIILGDNRLSSVESGGTAGSFGFAERGEAAVTGLEGRSQGRAALRDQAQNQSLDFSQRFQLGDAQSIVESQIVQHAEDPFQATLGLVIEQSQSVHEEMFPIELGDSGTQGGLSLAMPLPLRGNQLSFSRVGGDGTLVLKFRPTTTLETGIGWLWAVVWGVVIAWSAVRIARLGRDLPTAWNAAACPMIALGLLGFLMLSDPARWFGFALLAMGFITWAWQYRYPTPAGGEHG